MTQPAPILGREPEKRLLRAAVASDRAEFIALYGRRRIGKTFLVRNFVRPLADVWMEVVGQRDASSEVQREHFRESLAAAFGRPFDPLPSWDGAFRALVEAIEASDPARKVVVFLDELPWLASPRSGVLQALDYWWNARLSRCHNLTLIACGSAAGWMVDKLIAARGGLHNRVTRQIVLRPFTLPETRHFLRAKGSRMGLASVARLYMAVGGVPYYLDHVQPQHSADQAIQDLCFSRDGVLRQEFSRLFRSLFDDGESYEQVVRAVADRRTGVLRSELLESLKVSSGGGLAKKLQALEDAGFVAQVTPWDHRRRNVAYRIVDPYVFFYLTWMERGPRGLFDQPAWWLAQAHTPACHAWAGFAFETLCLQHAAHVQRALGLGDVAAEVGAWRFVPSRATHRERGAQVDLLFDRADGVITLCEIKHSDEVFTVDKALARELIAKVDVFTSVTRTRKDVQLALITTHGLKRNVWSEDLVVQDVGLEELFGADAG